MTMPTAPISRCPPVDMMVGMSRLLDDYGLDVWIWYPAMDRDYSDPGDGGRGAQGMGRGLPQAAARRRGFRARRRPGPYSASCLDAFPRQGHRGASSQPSPGHALGLSAGIQPGLAGRVPDDPQGRAPLAGRRRARAAGADQHGRPAQGRARSDIRSGPIRISPTASSASFRCPTGTWPSR